MTLVRGNGGSGDHIRARAVDAAKSRAMARQRTRDTGPELAVRQRLHALGYRYRVDHRPLPELRARGDLVFTRARVVVFVDGCFWHRCPQHATSPRHNGSWWQAKLAGGADLGARGARRRRRDHQSSAGPSSIRTPSWRTTSAMTS
jgi:DNA mismatch endonuclease Vsr